MSKADRLQELDGMIAKLQGRIAAYDKPASIWLTDEQKSANHIAVSELRSIVSDIEERRAYVEREYKD